jgi:hypothetical protein
MFVDTEAWFWIRTVGAPRDGDPHAPERSASCSKPHITRIQNKLGVRNRVEIATWSWENRIMGQV